MAVTISLSLSQGTPNTSTRTTTVSAKVTIHYSGGSYDGTSPSGSVTIDGQTFPFVKNFNYSGVGQGAATQGSGSTSVTITATVEYGESNSRTVYASASFSRASNSASGSITLTHISSGDSGGSGGLDDDDNTEEYNPNVPGTGSGYGDDYDPSLRLPGNCTVIGQAMQQFADGTIEYYPKPYYFVRQSTYSEIVIVKFITPTTDNISTSLEVNLYDISQETPRVETSMCCAICTSDENTSMYLNATSVVNDPNQIACVTLFDEEINQDAMPFLIPTTQLEGGKKYYLIFWQASDLPRDTSITIGSARYHGINVNYPDSKVIHIDNGTEYVLYQSYIDSGAIFELYTPYIDDGTTWVPAS